MTDRIWRDLAEAQCGLLSHRQLRALGVAPGEIRHHVKMERWARRSREVISTTTGPLSDEQRLWLGVLHAGPSAMVGGLNAVQQRLTTVDSLEEWLLRIAPLRRARQIRELLADVGGGAHSLAEVDFRKACRAHGIQEPIAQSSRKDSRGRRRYTDCEWRLADGRVLILEIDGAFHDGVDQATEHRRRNRRLSGADRIVVQCSAWEIRHEPWEVMRDLIALGVPRVS